MQGIIHPLKTLGMVASTRDGKYSIISCKPVGQSDKSFKEQMKFISRYQNSPRIKRKERRTYLAHVLTTQTLREFAVQVASEVNGNSAREDIALIRNW